MQLRYDEDFIETAVFLCASGRRPGVPSLQIARFHRERERLYGILVPDERNAAFFKLNLDWFREWGLEQPLTRLLSEFGSLRGRLTALAVRKATSRKEEGAELYVNEARERTALLALRLDRLTSDPALETYLRHEFMHLHDMVDPGFGYSPVLELPGCNAAQRRLAAERYRLLWDITIDGRIAAAGHTPVTSREQHRASFASGYSFWPEPRREETFVALWASRAPRHAEFLALIADPRGLREIHHPAPGASCPLCDFPTFSWADPGAVVPELADRIKAEFPAWVLEQGLCSRCLETYQALSFAVVW
jgi:hypothetical protein